MTLDYARLKRLELPVVEQAYGQRDTLLYALGVGVAAVDPLPTEDLKYVYEAGLQALPTQAVVLGQGRFWMADPEHGIDWQRVLQGEQFLTIHRPLPPQGRVRSQEFVEEIYDKGAGKGAVMVVRRELRAADSGELLATVGYAAFLRGNGGFGGQAEGAPRPKSIPERSPDQILDLPTRPEQAVIYRLSGDDNPLHIDPQAARAAGFERPILHGLCVYGLAGRAALKLLCGNDPARLRRFDVRFSSPTYPGETIRIELWGEGRGRAALRARALERDVVVLNNGVVEFDE